MSIWLKAQSKSDSLQSVLFLDRDGVVIVDKDYLADPTKVALVPGAAETIREAQQSGLLVVGVSNQSGLGRQFFSEHDFSLVMERIAELLAVEGAAWDGFYYCPHAPDDNCDCRKPRPGLLDELSETVSWNPATSWVVGDKESDIALGRGAKMGAVLVATGYGHKELNSVETTFNGDSKVLYAKDLRDAWRMIGSRPEMQFLGEES